MLVYTTIQHDFRKKNNLTCNEYVLCDMVYQLSVLPNSKFAGWCYMKREIMANEIGMAKRSIINLINRMIDAKFILKDPETSYLKTTEKWYNVYCMGGEETAPQVKKLHPRGEETAPQHILYNDNNKDKEREKEKKSSLTIFNIFLKVFKEKHKINFITINEIQKNEELRASGNLIRIVKDSQPELKNGLFLEHIENFFTKCLNTSNEYLYKQMKPSIILKYYVELVIEQAKQITNKIPFKFFTREELLNNSQGKVNPFKGYTKVKVQDKPVYVVDEMVIAHKLKTIK